MVASWEGVGGPSETGEGTKKYRSAVTELGLWL